MTIWSGCITPVIKKRYTFFSLKFRGLKIYLTIHLAEEERKTLQNIFDHFDVVDNEILKKITNENLKSMSDEDLLYWAQV
jgi:hypothetical protein